MVDIEEKNSILTLRAKAKPWQRAIGWFLLGTFSCALFGTLVPFLPPRQTSLVCDRASGKCTFTDRKATEFPVSQLLGATASFHKEGGRSNRQYLHHVVIKLEGTPAERTLCDAPDDAEDRTDNAKLAADIERFVHSTDVPSLSVQCDIGRTSVGSLIAALINGAVMLVIFLLVLRSPVAATLQIDKSTGTVVFDQHRLAFPKVTMKTMVSEIEGVRTQMVFRNKGVATVRGCTVLLVRDGVNLTILRPAASWSSTFQERIDAGKKIAAFLNVPVNDESAEPGHPPA